MFLQLSSGYDLEIAESRIPNSYPSAPHRTMLLTRRAQKVSLRQPGSNSLLVDIHYLCSFDNTMPQLHTASYINSSDDCAGERLRILDWILWLKSFAPVAATRSTTECWFSAPHTCCCWQTADRNDPCDLENVLALVCCCDGSSIGCGPSAADVPVQVVPISVGFGHLVLAQLFAPSNICVSFGPPSRV